MLGIYFGGLLFWDFYLAIAQLQQKKYPYSCDNDCLITWTNIYMYIEITDGKVVRAGISVT